MITRSPNYNWQNHHLADVDFSWDGYWFPERERARAEEYQRREQVQQGTSLGVVVNGPAGNSTIEPLRASPHGGQSSLDTTAMLNEARL
jgi:hypothetical protein